MRLDVVFPEPGEASKGAPVDTETGALLEERIRTPTPHKPRPPEAILETSLELIGSDLQGRLQREVGNAVHVINDADAAGLAEMRWGAGRGVEGMVLMLTLGTGIGTALFTQGKLVPNTELGHILIRGGEVELRASDRTRKQGKLSWKKWAKRLNEYPARMEDRFWPDLIIVGGGVSKKANKFIPRLET